jgi:hypothetical protein
MNVLMSMKIEIENCNTTSDLRKIALPPLLASFPFNTFTGLKPDK